MKARTLEEMELYLAQQPCEQCGTVTNASELAKSVTADGDRATYVYAGVCRRCGTQRRVEFDAPRGWPKLDGFAYGGDEHSELLTREQWLAIAERELAGAADDPSNLDPDAFFASNGALGRALAQLVEANKLGQDAALTTRIAEVRRKRERYATLSAAMSARRASGGGGGAPTSSTFGKDALVAHEQWLARGRKGPGRLQLDGSGVGGLSLGNIKLGGAQLVRVNFDRATIDFANFTGAELRECSARSTNFAHTKFDDARIENCNFEGARMVLTDCKDVKIQGGTFRGANADRGLWNRISIKHADLRDMRFGDCVLDGSLLEDCDLRGADLARVSPTLSSLGSALNTTFRRCDLRGAKLEGRRLDGTKLIDCKLAGVIGKPAIEGPYTVERPDFSAAGDGSDIRGAADVHALWGKPK
jgi:uncharacterized protein YjbI with pentapeptide repeats